MRLGELGSSLPLASVEMGTVIAVSSRVLGCTGSSRLFFKLPHRWCRNTAEMGCCHQGAPRRSMCAGPRSARAGGSERISIFILCQQPGNLPLDCFMASGDALSQLPGPHSGISYAVVYGTLYESIFSVSFRNPKGVQLCQFRKTAGGPGSSPTCSLGRLRLSCWKCNFFPVNFLQPPVLLRKRRPF